MNETITHLNPVLYQHFCDGGFFAISVLLLIYQLKKKENSLQIWLKWLLAFGVLISILSFVVQYIYNPFGNDMLYDLNMLQMLAVPASIMMIYEIVNPGKITWKSIGLSIMPFIILWGVGSLTNTKIVFIIALLLAIEGMLVIIVYALFKIKQYHDMLYNNYSNIEQRDLRWLSIILIEFLLLLTVWTVACIYPTTCVNIAYDLFSCLIWYSICYFVNRQKVIVLVTPQQDEELELSDTIEEDKTDDNIKYHFAEKLRTIIENEKRYLDPELNISDLAKELNTNRTYISQYLSSVMNTHFYDYINNLRIEHAAILLKDSDEKIECIATASGYNNTATFRRLFGKIKGCSPSEYRSRERIPE